MDTPANLSRVSSSQPKKGRYWGKKKLKKSQMKKSSMESSVITTNTTTVPKDLQPKLVDKNIIKPSSDVAADRTIMNHPAKPPKVCSSKSKKGAQKKRRTKTAVDEKVEQPAVMTSETGQLSTCSSEQVNTSKQQVKEGVKEHPEVSLTAPKTRPSSRASQAAPSKSLQKPATPVLDLDSSPSHQSSAAGPSLDAEIPAPSPRGKYKLGETLSAPASQASAVDSHPVTPINLRSPRRFKPIDEDAESGRWEPSTPVPSPPQKSSPSTKAKKGVKTKLIQPTSEAHAVEGFQTASGSKGRAEIAKNLAQVFATHQSLLGQYRLQKSVRKAKKFPFLRLPRELRDMILKHTIDYDGIDPMLVKINNTFPSDYLRSHKFNKKLHHWMDDLDSVYLRSVPTVLCLNQQIFQEAQEMLRKKTLRISHPPQYPIKGIYDLSHVISDDALSKISRIQFELHTYPSKEKRHDVLQQDWKGRTICKDECLADSYPWAVLLKDCFQVWRGTQESRYLEISIDHCSGGRSQFNLDLFGEKMLALEECVSTVLQSHDLDALMDFLIFADAPVDLV